MTFRQHQRQIKQAVDKEKNTWIMNTASLAEKAVKDDRTRWDCIRKLQMTQAGRKPTRSNAIYDENDNLIKDTEETREGWFRHFQRVLNIN